MRHLQLATIQQDYSIKSMRIVRCVRVVHFVLHLCMIEKAEKQNYWWHCDMTHRRQCLLQRFSGCSVSLCAILICAVFFWYAARDEVKHCKQQQRSHKRHQQQTQTQHTAHGVRVTYLKHNLLLNWWACVVAWGTCNWNDHSNNCCTTANNKQHRIRWSGQGEKRYRIGVRLHSVAITNTHN